MPPVQKESYRNVFPLSHLSDCKVTMDHPICEAEHLDHPLMVGCSIGQIPLPLNVSRWDVSQTKIYA